MEFTAKNAKGAKIFYLFAFFAPFAVFQLHRWEFWDKFADKFGLTPLTGRAHPGYNWNGCSNPIIAENAENAEIPVLLCPQRSLRLD